ncbi:MAG: hypothetical protein KAI86_01035 [Desulfobacterales bacterium]|jgi:hypothetical protein|nr:hypothetical protein [Desulfobacterales bacterium]
MNFSRFFQLWQNNLSAFFRSFVPTLVPCEISQKYKKSSVIYTKKDGATRGACAARATP